MVYARIIQSHAAYSIDNHDNFCLPPTSTMGDTPTIFDTNYQYQSLMFVINGLNDSSSTISSHLASAMATTSTLDLTSVASTSNTSNRLSISSLSSYSTCSSETAYDGSESDTDVGTDEGAGLEESKESDVYSYRLLPAVAMPSFVLGPRTMDAPWPYIFEKGASAFARGGNGTWRRVTLLDSGVVCSEPGPDVDGADQGSCALVYTAQWINASGQTFRATFCPTRGDIKPDDVHVRRLLAREGGQHFRL